MKNFAKGLVVGLAFVAMLALAQSYGAFGFGIIAPTVANCPPGSANNAVLCAVGPVSGSYTMYVSYNAGAYQLLAPAGATVTGTAPIVVNNGNVSCPSCLTTSSKVATAVISTATSTVTQ
jgi:hypothetical protein